MNHIYVDSSAYLAVALGESQADKLIKMLSGKIKLLTSSLLFLEVERNLLRLSRQGQLSAADWSFLNSKLKKDKEVFIIKELGMDLCLNQIFPLLQVPRSLDLAHLRTAMWFKKAIGLDGFVTLDKSQYQTAIELDLPVIEI